MAEMKVVYMAVSELVPYENNPRNNEKAVEAVANSIREFGFKNPIIVDRQKVIVSGHTRRLAAMKLGLDQVPVVYADDLTEDQIKAFRLADNRVAEMAAWDEDLLKEEMAKAIDFEFGDYGFDQKELDEIVKKDVNIKTHKCPRCGMEWTAREV